MVQRQTAKWELKPKIHTDQLVAFLCSQIQSFWQQKSVQIISLKDYTRGPMPVFLFVLEMILTLAQYFYSFKASHDALDEASQMICFDYIVLQNKKFENPRTRHRSRLWMSRNTGLLRAFYLFKVCSNNSVLSRTWEFLNSWMKGKTFD